MRVVLDVNILVSAILTPTPGQQAREIFRQAGTEYTLILSDFIFRKLESVLNYDRIQAQFPKLTQEVIQTYLTDLENVAELVSEHSKITEDEGSRDSEDNRILAAAIDGNATHLVTRNIAHFPETFRGVTVIEPHEFLQILRDKAQEDLSGEEE